ncbi:hypothetical protein GCM10009836_36760 [Pseudonocardia ailaonensis]|uniref:BEACH domain-containing protein n=1 Tax=Pseudonocardia ailaonensis TaxID=367279 RepID=A0ABN2N682_9PSEU
MTATYEPGFVKGADRVLDSIRRADAHAESEYLGQGPEKVVATVSSPERLAWSDSVTWLISHIDEDGKPFPVVATDIPGIRDHYSLMHGSGQRDSEYRVFTKLASEWWTFWHTDWYGPSSGIPTDHATYQHTENLTMLLTDGATGISGEIAWLRSWLRTGEAPNTLADRNRTRSTTTTRSGPGTSTRSWTCSAPRSTPTPVSGTTSPRTGTPSRCSTRARRCVTTTGASTTPPPSPTLR